MTETAETLLEYELVLHVWPGKWDLPTTNPDSLAAVLYAQLTIPGKFVVEECLNPDVSPNGQLPYLTHGLSCIASFASIVKYISGLHLTQDNEPSGDEERGADRTNTPSLGPLQRAQQIAWMAFVSADLGDLVACNFYTLRHNYYDCTRPTLAALLPLPQRYYVPDRLRASYKPRLEAAGLWNAQAEEVEEEKQKERPRVSVGGDEVVREAFGREKVLSKARQTLDILSNLLGDKEFFFHSRPTALDALTAAHILLLTTPPLPNDLLRTLVTGSYSALHVHARRMHARALALPAAASPPDDASLSTYASAFDLPHAHERIHARSTGAGAAPLRVRSAPVPSVAGVVSLALPWWASRPSGVSSKERKEKRSAEDVHFDRMRWAWYGLSVLGVVTWGWAVGLRFESNPMRGDSGEERGGEEGAAEVIREKEPEEEEEAEEIPAE